MISGKRSATGKPILANDPHLHVQISLDLVHDAHPGSWLERRGRVACPDCRALSSGTTIVLHGASRISASMYRIFTLSRSI